MSPQLRILNAVLRRAVKPMLARTETPQQAERDFRLGARLLPAPPGARLATRTVPGPSRPLRMTRVTCGPAAGEGAILYFHGGGFVAGSAWTHRGLLARLSAVAGVAVEAPDYRLAQEARLPAARDDALAAWTALLKDGHRPDRIVLAGDSAGGGLALGLLSDLCDRGCRPAGVVAFSPWTDLTVSSASHGSNAEADPLLPAGLVAELVETIASGDPADARLSPLFAVFDAPPPVLIQASRSEILRDDAVRIAERLADAGGDATLDLWDDTPHAWQIFGDWLPEAREARARAGAFVRRCLQTGAPASR